MLSGEHEATHVNLSSNDAILDPRIYPGLKSPFSQRLFKGSTK